MGHIYLKNISKVNIGGMHPGRVFQLQTDAAGVVIDMEWQRRLIDEAPTGHLVPFDPITGEVIVPKPAEATADASEPPSAPTDQQKD